MVSGEGAAVMASSRVTATLYRACPGLEYEASALEADVTVIVQPDIDADTSLISAASCVRIAAIKVCMNEVSCVPAGKARIPVNINSSEKGRSTMPRLT